MAVARSYEEMEIQGEPFENEGKMWVHVIGPCKRCGGSGHYSYNQIDGTTCLRCRGNGKESMVVRWYTDSQRASMDRAAAKRAETKTVKREEERIKIQARYAFGFGEEGFITLIWGNNDEIQDWRTGIPRGTVLFNTIFGWYMPSHKHVDFIPENIQHRRLEWTEVCDEKDEKNIDMKPNDIVAEYVQTLIHGESKSEYQGEKDTWLEHDVTIIKNIEVSSQYGDSHMHVMEDASGNVYVWTTASKSLEEGKIFHLRMKVKDHKEYKGVKQTIVYYCRIK